MSSLLLLLRARQRRNLFLCPSIVLSSSVASFLFCANGLHWLFVCISVCLPSLNTKGKRERDEERRRGDCQIRLEKTRERENYVWVPSGLLEDDCQWFSSHRFFSSLFSQADAEDVCILCCSVFMKQKMEYDCCASNMKRTAMVRSRSQNLDHGGWLFLSLFFTVAYWRSDLLITSISVWTFDAWGKFSGELFVLQCRSDFRHRTNTGSVCSFPWFIAELFVFTSEKRFLVLR